jgi:hypothetical protein
VVEMSFCTIADVRAIIDTDITDSEISQLIDETGAIMSARIDTGSINTLILRAINRTWTAYRCFLKDPDATALGEYREERAENMKLLKEQIDELIRIADGGIGVSYHSEALPFD